MPASEVHVTAIQIAQDMQQDQFFSTYNHSVLLVEGKVAAVTNQGNNHQIMLETGLPTAVVCDLGAQPANVQIGDVVTVQATASDAQRTSSAVELRKCSLH